MTTSVEHQDYAQKGDQWKEEKLAKLPKGITSQEGITAGQIKKFVKNGDVNVKGTFKDNAEAHRIEVTTTIAVKLNDFAADGLAVYTKLLKHPKSGDIETTKL